MLADRLLSQTVLRTVVASSATRSLLRRYTHSVSSIYTFTPCGIRSENMLGRALKTHESSRPASGSSSALQPSKPITQSSLANAFSTKPLPNRSGSQKPHILQSSQSPPNGIPPYRPVDEPENSQPLRKRPIAQQSALAVAFNTSSSFQENAAPLEQLIGQLPLDSMAALHDAVYFVETDFDDDDDLDFDISEPVIIAPRHATTNALPTPARTYDAQRPLGDLGFLPPLRPAAESAAVPPSSAPLLWSSSPAEHYLPRSIRPQDPHPETVQEEDERPKPQKARQLPWAPVAKRDGRGATFSTVRKSREGTRTSSGKVASDGMPWNDSFSNIEAGKKEARKRNAAKQQKRTITTLSDDLAERAMKSRETVAKIFLSEEQKRVIDLVVDQSFSVFFTGSAGGLLLCMIRCRDANTEVGTGKSVLLRELITVLKSKHKRDSDSVAVTASTGLAACNIGGVTLHSFAGIGLGKEPVPDLVRKVKRNLRAKNRWIRTKILIIDEISMVDGELFDKLEAIARQIRNSGQKFGGIKLVITGDFFQLPPVPDGGKPSKFAFDANSWNTCIEHTIGLTQVFRQRDPEFARMLNEMRLGKLSQETVTTFQKLGRPLQYSDGIQATELFSTRNEVDTSNNMKMRQLPGDSKRFLAQDGGTAEKHTREKLLSNCMAPTVIELKIHSQVMLIKNVDDTLVNGSLGRVVAFMSEKTFDVLSDRGDLDEALGPAEDTDLNKKQKKIREMMHGGGGVDTSHHWPLVQFALSDGTSRQMLCQPEIWKVELPNGEIQAQRTQVPLILAWALSIHKAQGQTLERVKVDLGRVFEKGQAYVALSRATRKEGLQVLRFDARKVMAHDKVREFYATLYSPAEAAKRFANASARRSLGPPAKKQRLPDEEDYPDFSEEDEMLKRFGGSN
jgi:ATP-dependent DNA helicase PIF1